MAVGMPIVRKAQTKEALNGIAAKRAKRKRRALMSDVSAKPHLITAVKI